MSDQPTDPQAASRDREAEVHEAARRRRRRAAVFGDSPVDAPADDPTPAEEAGAEQSRRDEELRRNVPPHHG